MPDYQLLSVLAKALDDTSALVLQAFNSRNPGYASGQGLDLLLPLYGISRENGEDDATVRSRIAGALAARGAGTLDAVEAAVKACRWVRDAKVYVNDTNATDSLGIPAHSLATVIFAGDGPAVAKAICDILIRFWIIRSMRSTMTRRILRRRCVGFFIRFTGTGRGEGRNEGGVECRIGRWGQGKPAHPVGPPQPQSARLRTAE